jgi:putative ABC transport system permease protein
LLSAFLPRSLREEAMDDLADGHALRAAREGGRSADRWYWRQVPGFVLRLAMSARSLGFAGRPARGGGIDMSAFLMDVRQTLRALRRSPAFTVIAVLTLTLGISANAVIFSVIRTVLLKPLPFPEPDRIVQMWETRLDRGWTQSSFTYANFWDVRDMNRTFEAVGALGYTSINLTGFDYPEQLGAARVSAGFFRALGASAIIGRTFEAGDDEPGANGRIVVLGHDFWQNRLNADRGVIGSTLTLNGNSYTVIGVLPDGEPWLDAGEVFIPLRHEVDADRGSFELQVVGRLRAGVSIDAARADLDDIAKKLAAAWPETDSGMGVALQSSSVWGADAGLRRALWILMGGVGLLLVIACVNLANLLLARATGRSRERALRATLGASRRRIAMHALVESLVLGLTSAALAAGLSVFAVRVLRVFQPGGIPRMGEVTIDGVVLAFTVLVGLGTSVLTGLVPALRLPRTDLAGALRDGDRGSTGSRRQGRVRSVLVGIEVAVSLVLLVGAGLLVRSFREVLQVDRGFGTANRLFAAVALNAGYDDARASLFLAQFIDRLEALPDVEHAAAINFRPLRGVAVGMGYASPDRPVPADDAVPWASWRLITPGYFDALGVRMVSGRPFDANDAIGSPWHVIVSRRIAAELWPGENAIGRTITLWKGQSNNPAEVIGVVEDMRDWGLESDVSRAVYIPYNGAGASLAHVLVQTRGSPLSIVPRMRSLLAAMDSNLPLSNVQTLDDMVGDSVASRRFLMVLLATFAAVALLLALAGVYGVLSWSVARRRSEIGVRAALGASRSTVMRLVMLQGMRPVLYGLVAGMGGAFAATRLMSGILFEVKPVDGLTYTAVAALLALTAAFACWVPARRATAVDVATALRDD